MDAPSNQKMQERQIQMSSVIHKIDSASLDYKRSINISLEMGREIKYKITQVNHFLNQINTSGQYYEVGLTLKELLKSEIALWDFVSDQSLSLLEQDSEVGRLKYRTGLKQLYDTYSSNYAGYLLSVAKVMNFWNGIGRVLISVLLITGTLTSGAAIWILLKARTEEIKKTESN